MIAEIRKPKVSVLMPVYNGIFFLKESIENILSQSFSDFEFIIVDDGSADGTHELLVNYANKDKRIRVLHNVRNMGIVFSLNRGLKECVGDYIVRMDADDIAMQNRIERQVAIMDNDKQICVLGCSVEYIDAQGKDLGFVRHCALGNNNLTKTPVMHNTVVIRRDCLVKHSLQYTEKYRFAEDYFLWLQLSKYGKISAINETLLKYRISSSAARVKDIKKLLLATLKVKWAAVFFLKIKPRFKDIIRFFLESLLFMLPSKIILFFYIKTTIGKISKISL